MRAAAIIMSTCVVMMIVPASATITGAHARDTPSSAYRTTRSAECALLRSARSHALVALAALRIQGTWSSPARALVMAGAMQPEMTPPAAFSEPSASPVGVTRPFPASGTTQWYRPTSPEQITGVLRIMDTSDLEDDKVVRIRDAFGTPVAQTYIREDEGAQLVLPLGRYEMTIAAGRVWYGVEGQFGAAATYFATSGADVIADETNCRIMPEGQGQPLRPIAAGDSEPAGCAGDALIP